MLKLNKNVDHEIDISSWGKFRVGDLFDAKLSKDDIQTKDLSNDGIPVISSGFNNNGVAGYGNFPNATLWENDTITVDMFGKSFYHNYQYYAVSHGRINILIPKTSINKYTGLYLCTILDKICAKYSYSNMCTNSKLRKEIIPLPQTPSNEPDWEYMESYMKQLEAQCNSRIEEIKQLIN